TNGFTINERVGRAGNHLVGSGETGDDLDGPAVVTPYSDGNELCFVSLNDGHAQAFRAEHESGHRNDEHGMRIVQFEVDLCIGSGEELALGVRDINFDEQSARGEVDGFRGANDLALESAVGKLSQRKARGYARDGGERVRLRHVDVDTQDIFRRHMKEL